MITTKTKLLLLVLIVTNGSLLYAATNRYRLTLRDDPATTIVIGWNQISGSNPVVYYGTTDHGTNWSAYSNNQAPSRQISYAGMNNQFARLTGLTPNTSYFFVIRDSEGTSQRLWFKTAPNVSTERLSFIAGGDSRNNRTPRINANKLVSKLRPHAVFFGGDMTSSGTNSEWAQWFDDWQYTIGTDGRMIPIVATRGNHESSNAMIYNLFDTPSSSVYYAITFGGNLIRAYTLNTEISISGNQTTWLQNDLQANNNTIWKMAQYHKPMRPHVSSKSEGNNQYNYWSSLFYNNNVKLVVECDAHTVKTTWPVKPSTGGGSDEGFIRDDQNGTVYVGEGCWGAPLRSNNDNKDWTRNSASFNQFKWVFVDANTIETRTIKVDNANQVGQVSDNNIFTPPANLDIWSPSNGSVVTINKSGSNPDPGGDITTSARISGTNNDVEENQNGTMYMNSSDLELVYDGSKGNQTIGLRFTGLNIPQGANILSAHVQFTTDETNSGTTNLTIKGHDTDNSPIFTTSSYNVSSRTSTSASVNWSPSAWSSVGQAGSTQKTPDIKTIIQELVDRNGWTSSSALSLIITGTGERTAESYDGASASAPVLTVIYNTEGSDNPDPSQSITFSRRVGSGNDDAEESTSGSIYLSSSDLELVYDSYMSAGNQRVGIRFTNINIPQGAIIENAYIQFTVDEISNQSGSKTIHGEHVANAQGYSTSQYNISNRNTTSNSVSWSPPSWTSVGNAGNNQKTPDLKDIVQEIVNLSGWNNGNAMSFVISGSGARVAESYNGSPGSAPLLVVTYRETNAIARVSHSRLEEVEQTSESPYHIYPNPFRDYLYIDMKIHDGRKGKVEVIALSGAILYSKDLQSGEVNEIDLNELSPGQYIVRVSMDYIVIGQSKIIKR